MLFKTDTFFNVVNMFLWNIVIVSSFHFIVFIVSTRLSQEKFYTPKQRYQALKFEQNGKFYKKILKINIWKDKVPQFTGKDGFSKEHIDEISYTYLVEFIAETCRGEWTHEIQCLAVFFTIIVNPLTFSWFFTLIVLTVNVPCTCIQRYNRIRLNSLLEKLLKHENSISIAA